MITREAVDSDPAGSYPRQESAEFLIVPARFASAAFQMISALDEAAAKRTQLEESAKALHEVEARLKVMVAELHHRTRNLLGMVRSIADRTLATSSSFEAFEDRVRSRLDALARVNGLLSRSDETARISFGELIRAELAGHGVLDEDREASRVTLETATPYPVALSLPRSVA